MNALTCCGQFWAGTGPHRIPAYMMLVQGYTYKNICTLYCCFVCVCVCVGGGGGGGGGGGAICDESIYILVYPIREFRPWKCTTSLKRNFYVDTSFRRKLSVLLTSCVSQETLFCHCFKGILLFQCANISVPASLNCCLYISETVLPGYRYVQFFIILM